MINLNYILLTVNVLSLCVKFTMSYYDIVESFEAMSTYDDETLTTTMSRSGEDEYSNVDEITTVEDATTTDGDVTTTDGDVSTTVEDITTTDGDVITTVKNLHTSVAEDFVYRSHALKSVGNKKSTEMHIGKVYQILESIINDGISDRNLNKTEQKPIFRFYEAFEDVTDEIESAPFEMSTNIAIDYVDKTLQEVSNEMLMEVSGKKSNVTNPLCPHFIYSPGLKMDKIADVWQPVYYDLRDKLTCFKILIRKTLAEEREQYEQWYGNYNESINWKECHFEIRSSAVKYRKHFLQGVAGDMGVMRNIILVQNKTGDFDLQEESPDQWLMLKSLLLLRDCETGGVIIFARVPYFPPKSAIIEALEELGVKMMGKSICNS